VVTNYSAGVLDKLGLGYEALRRVRGDLVMLASTGFGATGPNRSYVTWGPNIEALSGCASLSGFAHRDCTVTQYAYPDALSALHGLFAVLCALEHRTCSGEGQLIDLSQYEVTVAALGAPFMDALANEREPARRGNRTPEAAPQGCYPCAGEDRWCALSVRSDEEWRRLCFAIGCGRLAEDRRFASIAARIEHADEIDHEIREWTCTRDPYDVMRALQAVGVAAGVVQNVEDQLQRDPQLAAREFFERIEHKTKGSVLATGIPLGLTGTPGRTNGSGAAIGEDNAYVFGRLLGMSEQEIAALVEAGAIEPARSAAL
jgi:benzylsuccinate CoA-transferase BbsF subunit